MIATQKNNVEALIASHEKQFSAIMSTQQYESDRQFKLYERNVSALEAMAHQLSIVLKERSI